MATTGRMEELRRRLRWSLLLAGLTVLAASLESVGEGWVDPLVLRVGGGLVLVFLVAALGYWMALRREQRRGGGLSKGTVSEGLRSQGVMLVLVGVVPHVVVIYVHDPGFLIVFLLLAGPVISGIGAYRLLLGYGKNRMKGLGVTLLAIGLPIAAITAAVSGFSPTLGIELLATYAVMSVPAWGIAMMRLPEKPTST